MPNPLKKAIIHFLKLGGVSINGGALPKMQTKSFSSAKPPMSRQMPAKPENPQPASCADTRFCPLILSFRQLFLPFVIPKFLIGHLHPENFLCLLVVNRFKTFFSQAIKTELCHRQSGNFCAFLGDFVVLEEVFSVFCSFL